MDLFPALKGPLLEIPGRQHPEVLRRHYRDRRSVQVQRMFATLQVVAKALGELLDEFAKGFGIVERHFILSPHGHRLQLLGTHDRADSGAAGSAIAIVHDRGKQDSPFTRRANAGHTSPAGGFLLEGGIGFMGGLAPEMSRRAKLDLVTVNPEVDGFGSLAMKGDHVDPGLFQFRRKLPSRVGTGYRSGQRRFGHDHVAAAGRRLGAGQRTGGHDQNVLGSQGITIRVNFGEQALNAESSSADEILGNAEGPATLPAPHPESNPPAGPCLAIRT